MRFSRDEIQLLCSTYEKFPDSWERIVTDFMLHVDELGDQTKAFYESLPKKDIRRRLQSKFYKMKSLEKKKVQRFQ